MLPFSSAAFRQGYARYFPAVADFRQGYALRPLPGGSKGGKLADGRAAVLALTPGRAALCHRLKFHLFSKLKRSRRAY